LKISTKRPPLTIGRRISNIDDQAEPSQCDPYGLYVQLFWCPSLDNIMLLSKASERDIGGREEAGTAE
jgi:hypothetical protein